MAVTADLLERAGELKRELVEFSEDQRYDRAFREALAQQEGDLTTYDEQQLTMFWDYFVLEHRLRNGRRVVEQFVDARPDLSEPERKMLLGWRDVVQGPFEVQRRDGAALIVVNLVDELTYRVRSNMGPAVFRQMPRRSFLITRLVPVGEEWMLSGPSSVFRPSDEAVVCQVALELALQAPELMYRNPEKLAQAWEIQREDRDRFVRFFGSDLVVLPGDEAQDRVGEFWAFSREETLRPAARPDRRRDPAAPLMELPPDLTEAETVAMIYDEVEGLNFYAEFGLVEAAFAEPELLRRRRYREQTLGYLEDDSVAPLVFRRLAERDPARASAVFRRLLRKPRFDWTRDGEALLRTYKPDFFERPPQPRVSPLSERLAAYAERR
jgi:hypothetical protein